MDKNKKLFPQRLWELIHDEKYHASLRWSHDGQRVYLNRNAFENSYLRTSNNKFHTQKAISFVRQMNMYGFKKVDDCYYENENFKRNCYHLIKNMVRRHSNRGFPSHNQISHQHHHQSILQESHQEHNLRQQFGVQRATSSNSITNNPRNNNDANQQRGNLFRPSGIPGFVGGCKQANSSASSLTSSSMGSCNSSSSAVSSMAMASGAHLIGANQQHPSSSSSVDPSLLASISSTSGPMHPTSAANIFTSQLHLQQHLAGSATHHRKPTANLGMSQSLSTTSLPIGKLMNLNHGDVGRNYSSSAANSDSDQEIDRAVHLWKTSSRRTNRQTLARGQQSVANILSDTNSRVSRGGAANRSPNGASLMSASSLYQQLAALAFVSSSANSSSSSTASCGTNNTSKLPSHNQTPSTSQIQQQQHLNWLAANCSQDKPQSSQVSAASLPPFQQDSSVESPEQQRKLIEALLFAHQEQQQQQRQPNQRCQSGPLEAHDTTPNINLGDDSLNLMADRLTTGNGLNQINGAQNSTGFFETADAANSVLVRQFLQQALMMGSMLQAKQQVSSNQEQPEPALALQQALLSAATNQHHNQAYLKQQIQPNQGFGHTGGNSFVAPLPDMTSSMSNCNTFPDSPQHRRDSLISNQRNIERNRVGNNAGDEIDDDDISNDFSESEADGDADRKYVGNRGEAYNNDMDIACLSRDDMPLELVVSSASTSPEIRSLSLSSPSRHNSQLQQNWQDHHVKQ